MRFWHLSYLKYCGILRFLSKNGLNQSKFRVYDSVKNFLNLKILLIFLLNTPSIQTENKINKSNFPPPHVLALKSETQKIRLLSLGSVSKWIIIPCIILLSFHYLSAFNWWRCVYRGKLKRNSFASSCSNSRATAAKFFIAFSNVYKRYHQATVWWRSIRKCTFLFVEFLCFQKKTRKNL